MKPILIVFTGGTIGTKMMNENEINLTQETKYELIKESLKKFPELKKFKFESREPINTLSENMTIEHYDALLREFKKVDFDKYLGVIITHGTDTLAFTSNFMSIILNKVSVPVVLIASNRPLNDKKSDAFLNFHDAVMFIYKKKLPGVFVVFDGIVHFANRILQCKPFVDTYESVYGFPFGTIKNSKFSRIAHKLNPTEQKLKLGVSKKLLISKFKEPLTRGVIVIRPYTGFDYSTVNLNNKTAVLVDLYHSGTTCTNSKEKTSFKYLVECCKEKNIPIFVAPIKKSGTLAESYKYETTKTILENATPITDVSLECAYAKLICTLSLAKTPEKAIELVNKF